MTTQSAVANLFVTLGANAQQFHDELSGTLKAAQQWAGQMSRTAGAALTGGIAAGATIATAAVAAIGKEAFDVASQFERASGAIIAGTGASGEALTQMEGIVRSLSMGVGGLGNDMETLGGVVAEVNTRTGLTGSGLQAFSDNMLQFTRLVGGDAVANVQKFTRVMGDWGVTNENSAELFDMLHGAGQAFGIGFDSLSRKLVQFGAPLRQMGFSIEESIALLGKWEKEGVNTEKALGSLRIAAGKFARENIPLRQGLEDTFEAIRNAANESDALSLAMATFGAEAGPDMAAAIREGRFELESALEALDATSGGFDDAAERTLNFNDRLQLLKNKGRGYLLPVGNAILSLAEKALPKVEAVMDRLLPVFEGFANRAGNEFNGIIPIVRGFGKALEWIWNGDGANIDGWYDLTGAIFWLFTGKANSSGGPAEKLSLILYDIGRVASDVINFLRPMGQMIGRLVQEFVGWQDVVFPLTVMIASFLIPTIGALLAPLASLALFVAGAIAVTALLRNAWERNFGGIQEMTAGVWAGLQEGWDAFKSLFAGDWEGFLDGISSAFSTAFGSIVGFLGNLWGMAQPHLQAFWEGAVAWFQNTDWKQLGLDVVNFISEGAGLIWERTQPKLQTLWEGAVAWFQNTDWKQLGLDAVNFIVNGISDIWARVQPVLMEWIDSLTVWFAEIDWEGLGYDAMTAVLNGLQTIWDFLPIIGQWGLDVFDKFMNWVNDMDWGGLGSSIVDGIWGGLMRLETVLINGLTNMMEGAWNAVLDFWDIDSPSKRAENELAGNIVDGVDNGFMKGDVSDSFQSLFDPLNNFSFGGLLGGGDTTTDNREFTFNITNNDPQSTAELILGELGARG